MVETIESMTGLPLNWKIKRLRDLSTDIGDGIHATPVYSKNNQFFFINGNNLMNGAVKITDNTLGVSEQEYKKYKKPLGSQTLLMSINGTIGNLAYFNNDKIILGKSAAYINLGKSVSKQYIFYMLQMSNVIKYFDEELTGTTIRNLSLEALRNTPICLPPTEKDQVTIAQVLSDVDALIKSLDRLIVKKKCLMQGAMQKLLTGKKRLSGFSEKWSIKKIKEIAYVHNGGTPATNVTEYWNGSICWSIPTDITHTKGKYLFETERKITEAGLANSSAKLLPIGTLLLCSRATIGELKISRVKVATNQGFKSLLCFNETDNEFIYYKLLTIKNKLIEKANGSTFLEISKKDLENISLSVAPTKNEQTAIAQILSAMDLEIESFERKRDKCRLLKVGLMQQLLTGRIRLKCQS